MTLGEILADMVLYGDLDEAPWPCTWCRVDQDEEYTTRCNVAATLLKLTHETPGGSCSRCDKLVRPLLQQEVPGT